jgi:hypothetical protein
MHMVTLYSQLKNVPLMFIGHIMNELFKPRSHRPSEDLPPSPWAPDNMVHNQMDGMDIMNVVHVYRLLYIDTSVKRRTRLSPYAPLPSMKR